MHLSGMVPEFGAMFPLVRATPSGKARDPFPFSFKKNHHSLHLSLLLNRGP